MPGRWASISARLFSKGRFAAALIVGVVSAVAVVAVASGDPYVSTCFGSTAGGEGTCPGFPPLVARFGGRLAAATGAAPEHRTAPVSLRLWGRFSTSDGTHPSALREMTLDLDRGVAIDARGLAACHGAGGSHDGVGLKGKCEGAAIGGGRADLEIAVPGKAPIRTPSKLTLYNGGSRNGVRTAYAIGEVKEPAPAPIVATIEIREVGSGLRAVAKLPAIAIDGGNGSLIDFHLKVKRLFEYKGRPVSYLSARCPDRQVKAAVTAQFENETETPGVPSSTVMRGVFAIPCAPAA